MARMQDVSVRRAHLADYEQLARLRHALWPETSADEHAEELRGILRGEAPGVMPLVEIVCNASDGTLVGFIEVGLRSHADGCDESRAVGYVEGWYVVASSRRQGIGARLLRAAEDWARSQGCKEMASDALIENANSQRAHEALGFEVVGRNVLYRKRLISSRIATYILSTTWNSALPLIMRA